MLKFLFLLCMSGDFSFYRALNATIPIPRRPTTYNPMNVFGIDEEVWKDFFTRAKQFFEEEEKKRERQTIAAETQAKAFQDIAKSMNEIKEMMVCAPGGPVEAEHRAHFEANKKRKHVTSENGGSH